MESSRLPRFKRAAAVAPMELTERDRQIIRVVHRHRFLRSPQIVALIGGGSQQVLRRLQLLYHHGYLERPPIQLEYFHRGGSHHMVYGLGNNGAALLKHEYGIYVAPRIRWDEKNRSVGRVYLEHTLLVSEVMVAIELACRQNSQIRLITDEEPPLRGRRVRWRVNTPGGAKLGIMPDRAFALEYPGRDGNRNRVLFFLEADRATMPVQRNTLSQTSMYRKFLAYAATWSQSIHQSQFGFNRFRVLTVTTSEERMKSLVNACLQLEHGHGLFLFIDRESVLNDGNLFAPIWQTCKQGQEAGLID